MRVIFVLFLLLLVGCVGQAIFSGDSSPAWASALRDTVVSPSSVKLGDEVKITVSRPANLPSSRDYFAYSRLYIYNRVFPQPYWEEVRADKMLSGKSEGAWLVDKAIFSFVADSDLVIKGDNFFIVYNCFWTGDSSSSGVKKWDCSGGKWQLGSFKVV